MVSGGRQPTAGKNSIVLLGFYCPSKICSCSYYADANNNMQEMFLCKSSWHTVTIITLCTVTVSLLQPSSQPTNQQEFSLPRYDNHKTSCDVFILYAHKKSTEKCNMVMLTVIKLNERCHVSTKGKALQTRNVWVDYSRVMETSGKC